MIFLMLLIFPVLVALFFKFIGDETHKVTLREFLVQIGAQVAIAAVSVFVILHANVSDHEIWNGRIVKKQQERVSCSHSHQCRCRQSCTGTGKSRSCSRVCDTCYDHLFDYDWMLYTSNKESIEINRVDRQGTQTPSRWASVQIGDPTAIAHSYENFVKASPESLFAMHGLVEEFKTKLPKYPSSVYDYYHINRAVGKLPNKEAWNHQLMELNADIGHRKQANVIVVGTPVKDSRFYEALNQHWLGGKKNDIVVVLHAEQGKIAWARVMAWVDDEIVKIKIRDDLLNKELTPEVVLPIVKNNVVKYYKRKPMHDFEYLESSIKPTTTQWIVSMLIGLLVSVGLGWYFWKNDAFNEEYSNKRFGNYRF